MQKCKNTINGEKELGNFRVNMSRYGGGKNSYFMRLYYAKCMQSSLIKAMAKMGSVFTSDLNSVLWLKTMCRVFKLHIII